jgi:hypothetical protein
MTISKAHRVSRAQPKSIKEINLKVAGQLEHSDGKLNARLFVNASDVLVPNQGLEVKPGQVELIDERTGKVVALGEATLESSDQLGGSLKNTYSVQFDGRMPDDGIKYRMRVQLESKAIDNGHLRAGSSGEFVTSPIVVEGRSGWSSSS